MRKDFSEFKSYIKGKNTAVLGIGISNRPLIHFLLSLGAKVSAFDKKTEGELGEEAASELKQAGAKLVLGKDYLEKLSGYEVIFKTPSMRIDSPELLKAKEEGTYITSEMEEFIKYCRAKIIGVTGSDGKTTTTTLIYNMLKEQGYKTWVGGNIGVPLFSKIEEIKEEDRVVLELSSFQLMTMKVSPEISIITNLSPNHLDMHKDMQEYIDSKKNIFKYQNENGLLILNKDNDITNSMVSEAKGRVMQFSIKEKVADGGYFNQGKLYVNDNEICNKDDIIIKGMFNVQNYLAAFCALINDVDVNIMKKTASTFKGVEHRNEFVREIDGVKYYNNSIASSPTRTLASISIYDKPIILIAGGYDKHIPFQVLADEGYPMIKVLILLGNTKYKIKEAFENIIKEKNISIEIILTESLEEAVFKAKEIANSGDIVSLSPACASFDMFTNFEERGNKFKRIVNEI
ncbi:MAG: UDP-N-acetylmuramoyl-L-alanine--D-glutamate ligase [Bacillota bacterium]|nr:UDP-N-acetylmuramoyl-L-alanine--D-glutamate ligase [Bacillota bacterium]